MTGPTFGGAGGGKRLALELERERLELEWFRRDCDRLGLDADRLLAMADELAKTTVLSTSAARARVFDAAAPPPAERIEQALRSRPSPSSL